MATIPRTPPSRHLITVDAFHRIIDAVTRRTRVFRQPIAGSEPGSTGSSGYAHEVSLEPHEPLTCPGVIDDAGDQLMVALAKLLPVIG